MNHSSTIHGELVVEIKMQFLSCYVHTCISFHVIICTWATLSSIKPYNDVSDHKTLMTFVGLLWLAPIIVEFRLEN